jgi:hypothetical protein
MAETIYELLVCESCQYAINQINIPKMGGALGAIRE